MSEGVTGDVHVRHSSPPSPDHEQHDRLLVVRYVSGDAPPAEAEAARELVRACADCSRLATDITLIMRATRELPSPRRPRDFRLSREQADNLRGNALQRLLRGLAATSLTGLRPVAGVALSVGLLMAVVGTAIPSSDYVAPEPALERASQYQAGEEAAGPDAEAATPDAEAANRHAAAATPAAAAAPDEVPAAGAPGDEPAPLQEPTEPSGPRMRDRAVDMDTRLDEAAPPAGEATAETMRTLLLYGGLGLALISLGALVMTWLLRREVDDPLLR